MGRVYGVQGRSWAKPDGTVLDQLTKIVDNLTAKLLTIEAKFSHFIIQESLS